MIEILMNFITNRTQSWQYRDSFNNAVEAKKVAAQLFIECQGAKVVQYGEDTFVVFIWSKGGLINE